MEPIDPVDLEGTIVSLCFGSLLCDGPSDILLLRMRDPRYVEVLPHDMEVVGSNSKLCDRDPGQVSYFLQGERARLSIDTERIGDDSNPSFTATYELQVLSGPWEGEVYRKIDTV